ncbi:MAG: transglutaminase-like domain-containing protein, partial [Chloroflexota bacterium]
MNSALTYRQGWLGHSSRSVLPPMRRALKGLVGLLIPNQGWATFLLVLMVVLSVTWSVESADWARTPGLTFVVFTGAMTGMTLAKLRVHGLILLGLGLLAGVFTVLWFLVRFVDGGPWRDGLTVLGERLKLWYAAAATDGISSDLLPFTVALVTLVWLLGYTCAWFAFRYRNIWVPLVVAGLGILTNLSYLPSSHGAYFVLFLLFAFLAVGWMSALERRRQWSRQHIQHSSLLGAMGIYNGLQLGFVAVLVAMLLPVGLPRPPFLKRGYEYLRWPVERLQGDFNRLFAAVPARKPMLYRFFDNTLPFQGAISLSDEVVFTIRSSRPSYWRVRSYPIYTSKGWVSGATQMVPMQWQPKTATPEQYQEREEVIQHVRLNYSPRLLAAAGVVQGSTLDVEVELPVPLIYDIPITDTTYNPALPPEVQVLGQRLRAMAAREEVGLRASLVQDILPKDMELAGLHYGEAGVLTGVSIRRAVPVPLDVLSLRSQRRLFTSDEYTVTSTVSVATAQELRQAGNKYPGWVRDIYLQLPDTLPKRVIDLARRLTAEAETPYDKAEAIAGYLRTLPYTTNVPAPAYDADGVDHFLFNLGAGYSDYFGSAMAVMLRAVGVPTRMAVGYGMGEVDEEGNVIVRDRNSHGWTEVFFPGYGWVE